VNTAPPISLADLAKVKPVDFKGREIRATKPAENISTENESDSRKPAEHELSEGEDIKIEDNKF